jgi:hypothetical protein
MSDLKNFESQEQKEYFFQILKNGIRSFLSVGLIVFGAMWLLGILGNTNHHIACNAENVGKKKRENYFEQDGNYFKGGDFQSQDFAFEGKHSLKLNADNPFGFSYDYEFLKGNEEVLAWVWRYAEGDWKMNGKMVASAAGKFWRASEEVIEIKENGWEKIQFKFKIPNFLQNEPLNIYCWNPDRRPIYFDDFHIVIQELEEL